jgi:putative ABC transport system permease protein
VDVEDRGRSVRGLVLSMPEERTPVLCDAILRTGSWFSGDRRDEVILSTKFAEAHGYAPGSSIPLITGGQRRDFHVIGTAQSSEYVYITPPGSLAPDPKSYGLFLVTEETAEELYDLSGAANSLVGRFTPEARANPEPVLTALRERLSEHGVFAAIDRPDQMSHMAMSSELDGIEVMAISLPLIFFGVSALILNVLLTRMVQRQRAILGTLKALGYRDGELLAHFIRFGAAVAIVGGFLGCLLGFVIAGSMTRMYGSVYEFPRLDNRLHLGVMALAVATGVLCAAAGAWRGARGVLAFSPAEAMRPAPPVMGGAIALERVGGLWSRLDTAWRIVLRGVARHRARTAVGVGASAMGASLVVCGLALSDSLDEIMSFQFDKVLVSDYTIVLRSERGMDAVSELRGLPGVTAAEPSLVVACTFEAGQRSKRGAITGVPVGASLTVPHDDRGEPVPIPPDGLLIPRRLAEELGVEPGDMLGFRPVKGRRELRYAPIAQVVESRLGLAVYADLERLGRWVDEPDAVSQVQVTAAHDEAERIAFVREVRRRPGVETLSVTAADRILVEEEYLGMMRGFTGVIILFAGVIFFGSVLNAALVNLAERRREVATFRALGWTGGEIGSIFLRESLLVNLAGVLPGLVLGALMIDGLMRASESDLFSMSAVVLPRSYLATIVISPLFALLAHVLVRRALRRTNWLADLGARE